MTDAPMLTEAQIQRISPYFPRSRGRPRVDDRRVLSGIVFVNRKDTAGSTAREISALLGDPPEQTQDEEERWKALEIELGGLEHAILPGPAAAVPHIRERLDRMGVDVPLVGDFHYIGHQLLADHPACAEALAKYRINPGNVGFKEKKDRQLFGGCSGSSPRRKYQRPKGPSGSATAARNHGCSWEVWLTTRSMLGQGQKPYAAMRNR